MAKYLDPKADVTFKKVFGEHKNLVISFLNALLPLDEGKKIMTIEYLPSEMTPRTPFSKDTIVDVRCEETGGRKLLNLVNDTFEPEMDGYYHYYSLVHYLNSKKVLDGLHLVFIELPKFKAKNLTEKKMQVLWLRFLTEIDENTKKVAKALLDDPHVNEALEIVEESAYSEAEMLAYDKFWDRVSREATREANLKEAEEKLGTAERDAANARADAAEAKLRQDKLDTARKMKADGLPMGTIAKYTGLAAGEIKAL